MAKDERMDLVSFTGSTKACSSSDHMFIASFFF